MNVKEKIVEIIENSQGISGAGIARELGISRQAVHKHLN